MTGSAERFYKAITDAVNLSDSDLVGLFAYHITVEMQQDAATANEIDACFRDCSLTAPRRTAAYLSEGVKAKKFVKADRGYRLQRHYRDELSRQMGAGPLAVQTNAELRQLEGKVPAGPKKEFLKETIDCFGAGANRASVIMCWILALDHLYDYVMKHSLSAFNEVLAKNADKRVRVTKIQSRDQFGDIPEGKFIEFLRASEIISNDVRKILDEKLGVRNSCAHPSGITVKPSKVVEFVDDLVENVILKYQI